ncbi:MAG: cytochrome c biogenesis protein CcsA [Armatimonadota bacterium]
MNALGYSLIIIAALSMLVGLIAGIRRPGVWWILRICQTTASLTSLSGLAILAWLVASHDPNTAYAIQYTAPIDASIGYKIAAVWAGQAGGLLLWCMETTLIALAVHPKKHPYPAAILCGIQFCLLSLVVMNNPFAQSSGESAAGLNPILMHPMMLIHPPMLFLGYALLSVPYAITAGSLIAKNPSGWRNDVKPWILIAWLTLTLGNGFGASWAYKTFGWGGFWSWDPVENTSFVPWLLAGIVIHGLCISTHSGKWLKISAICAMMGFITVLYGSFLARSGLLAGASVHAYLEIDKLFLWALGGLLAGSIIGAVICLSIGWKSWNPEDAGIETSDSITGWGTAVMIIIAVLVLAGMSLPIIKIAPTTSAYNIILIPFALIMMMLLAWNRLSFLAGKTFSIIRIILASILFAGLLYLGYTRWQGGGILYAIPAALSPAIIYCAMIVMIMEIYKLFLDKNRRVGESIAHIGLAMLLTGAILSGYGTRSTKGFLHVAEKADIYGVSISLVSMDIPRNGVSRAILDVNNSTGQVEIEKNEKFSTELLRPLIRRHPMYDLYITPLAIISEPQIVDGDKIEPGVMLEISMKNGISLVWLGMIFMGLGILYALIRRKHNKPGNTDGD